MNRQLVEALVPLVLREFERVQSGGATLGRARAPLGSVR